MSDENRAASDIHLMRRPRDPFLQLPLNLRWEVTRRHPYYLRFWKNAAASGAEPSALRDKAQLLLLAINVVGIPVDPSTEFEELNGKHVNLSFLGGAIAPLTYRSFAIILAERLTSETMRCIGRELMLAADVNRDSLEEHYRLIRRLTDLQLPELDMVVNDGIVSFNPRSPNRAILKDFEQYISGVKREHRVVETRRRFGKIDEYLHVWDQREGWKGSGYDFLKGQRLTEIAKTKKRALRTISDQYRSAFEVITGHTYHPDLWFDLFGLMRLQQAGAAGNKLDFDRPMRIRQLQTVPESVLQSSRDGYQLQETAIATTPDIEVSDLRMDFKRLIADGKTDAQIATALGNASRTAVKAVQNLREHMKEMGEL